MTYESKDRNRNSHKAICKTELARQPNGNKGCSHTDQEHPLPPLKTASPLHRLMHSRHHDTRKQAANLSDRREDCSPLSDLRRLAIMKLISILSFPRRATLTTTIP